MLVFRNLSNTALPKEPVPPVMRMVLSANKDCTIEHPIGRAWINVVRNLLFQIIPYPMQRGITFS